MRPIARYGKVSNRVGGLYLRPAPKVEPGVKPLDALNPGDRVFIYYTDQDNDNWAHVQVVKSGDKGWLFLPHIDLDPVASPILDEIEEAPLWPYYVGIALFILAVATGVYYW